MNIIRAIAEIASGVADELRADFRDVTLALLDLMGLGQVAQQIFHELYEPISEESQANDRLARARRKNLIRIIGTALPLQPVQRPYLRYVALRSLSTSCDSLFSVATQSVFNNGFGNKELDKESICSSSHICSESTFNHYASGEIDSTSVKIAALEEELSSLRAQIASIICHKPEQPLTPPSTPIPFDLIPPPPPPPPPPPLLQLTPQQNNLVQRTKSFAELLSENKENLNQPIRIVDNSTPKHGEGIDFAEVLKGINKVQLKRIARSPGGTPHRPRPRTPPPMDATSLIAAALKKRFAMIHADSPEKDNDTTSEFSDSEATPIVFRKSRRDDFEKSNTISPHINNNFVLKKTPIPPKVKVKDAQHSPPPFGQHLLKRRQKPLLQEDNSPSPSGETSDASR